MADESKKRHRHHTNKEEINRYRKKIKNLETSLATKTSENEEMKSLLESKSNEMDKLAISSIRGVDSLNKTIADLKASVDTKNALLRQSISPTQYKSLSDAYEDLKKKYGEIEIDLENARQKKQTENIERPIIIESESVHTTYVEVARIFYQVKSIFTKLSTRSMTETEYLSKSLQHIKELEARLNIQDENLKGS